VLLQRLRHRSGSSARSILQDSGDRCYFQGQWTEHGTWHSGPSLRCECWNGKWRNCEDVKEDENYRTNGEYDEKPDPMPYCSDGYEWDDSKQYCMKYEAKPAEMRCQTGWEVKSRDGQKYCWYQEEKEYEERCPDGYEWGDTGTDKKTCVKMMYKDPEYYCDGDYSLTGTEGYEKCVKEKWDRPEWYCPDDYKKRKDGGWECYKEYSNEPKYRCEDGWQYEGGECKRSSGY